jgi:hypothetical protein
MTLRRLTQCLSWAAASSAAALGQIEPSPSGAPIFKSSSVLFGNRSVPLAPGLALSIYGTNLGPAAGCEGQADTEHRETPSALVSNQNFVNTLIYPKQLCETQVLVGGIPAGLLYVQARQINFKVPQETPIQGTAELRVIYKGQSSKPVALPLGIETTTLSLASPARVGMPVWLKVQLPYEQAPWLQYPFMIFPASFGCNEIEVRRDGKLLTRIADMEAQAFMGVIIGGFPCGSIAFTSEPHFKGRIPLHLQYRFDRPGTYEVRLTPRNWVDGNTSVSTGWTRIEIPPGSAQERKRWLTERSAHPPTQTADLLTDFLPSILGIPDDQSLLILRGYLYHADTLVREYAMYGLTYWPEQQAAPKTWELMRSRGPSDAIVDFLVHVREFTATHAEQMIESSIPFLQSDSVVLMHGAVKAISRIALPADSQVSADVRTRAGDAMIRAADHIIHVDRQNLNDYIADLAQVHDPRVHDLLWDLVNRRVGYEQALIALSWLKSPEDLPKLAQLALQPANGRALEYDVASLPYALHNAYGDSAIPYVERMVERSEYTWVRTNGARELVLAGRPTGFAFMADAIENARFYRAEMIQFLRDQFPELRQSDDVAILRFVQARAHPKH